MRASLHFTNALLPKGWASDVRVTVRDGVIAAVETGVAVAAGDERHAIALPGLPNLHSHAFQRGMAGLAEMRGDSNDSFWTWRETMYRFVDRIGPDELEAIAALAYVEMLETGFTRVGEFHYLHHDVDGRPFDNPARMAEAIANAAAETGIALTLLPVFYAHSGFGGAPPGNSQRRFVCDTEAFVRLREASGAALSSLPDAVLGTAPHSLRAVTPDELRDLLTHSPAGPIHIHIAEQIREVDDCIAWSGARPVEWLLANADIDRRWCLVHATHMTEAETDAVAGSGAVVGLCPITEANLGDGIFPARRFISAGGRYGLGSDSNVLIDASEEMRVFEYGQRLLHRQRNVLASSQASHTGAAIYQAALDGGTTALGSLSGIVIGNPADLISFNADHPCFIAREGDALLDSWIFAAGSKAIDCVWRRGEKLVSGGRHRSRPAIASRYQAAMRRLIG